MENYDVHLVRATHADLGRRGEAAHIALKVATPGGSQRSLYLVAGMPNTCTTPPWLSASVAVSCSMATRGDSPGGSSMLITRFWWYTRNRSTPNTSPAADQGPVNLAVLHYEGKTKHECFRVRTVD